MRNHIFRGIDVPYRKELIAANYSLEAIQKFLGVDKLLYQEMDDLVEAVTRKGDHHIDDPCMACMNGCYVTGDIDAKKMSTLESERGEKVS